MDSRELILLSPYRIPAKDSLFLGDEDVAAFLNGYSVLWHPALIGSAAEPPRVGSPYDYEAPTAGHVYAVPESPQLFLAEDWEDRVRNAGAVSFRATPERKETLAHLHEAQALPELRPEQLAPFFGLAFGYLHLLALFEAMDHENLLATAEFWQAVQQAADATLKSEDPQPHLQAAADKLMAAREALYPTTIHVLDLCTLDELPARGLILGGLPLNLIASARGLEAFLRDHPEAAEPLRVQVQSGQIEVCLGSYVEREDALLPIESQFWNLLRGLRTAKDLLGSDVRVFARRRFGAAPQLPLLLSAAGLERALAVSFDDSSSVSSHGTVVHWTAPNGKQIEVFTRNPYHADAPGTYFHAAYHLHQTIAQDFVATLGLVRRGKPACAWHEDWLQLTKLAPVLGRFETLSNYFGDVVTGEQASTTSADDFPSDYLTDRTERHVAAPVSWFARQARLRRSVDTIWTLAALHRGLAGQTDKLDLHAPLEAVEDQVELDRPGESEAVHAALTELQDEAGAALASRLLARATGNTPGYLVLNPCNFTRRVAIEVDITGDGLPLEGPLKACQVDNGRGRLVVEVPALGFAWVPRQGNVPPPAKRIKLADERHVRNEFFEAEIDPATGGLRGLWDPRSRISRVGQMLVYNPGSTMRASSVRVTSAGPALGEVVTEGAVLGDQQQVLATFRQRFRAWLGRPILELRIEIFPEQAPKGYPWHAYFGARFAWRDERATLLRGVNGTGYITSQTRPDTPAYLEWRYGRQSTTLFPGGLPFHQRHGARMLDVVLIPEGEETTAFELGLGLDREYPMQTAFGMISPVPVIPVEQGPPHVGAAGWLFHLDAANLLLTSMRPAAGADAVVARVLECALHSTHSEFRCVRNPSRAYLLDAHGEKQSEASVSGDAAHFEVAASDCAWVRIEF